MDTQNTQNTQNNCRRGNNIFSFLYRTRVRVVKGDIDILNLSLAFSVLAVCTAPWVAVIGLVIALALGYRFSIERNAAAFSGDFDAVVKDAAGNVKAVVDSVVGSGDEHKDNDEQA